MGIRTVRLDEETEQVLGHVVKQTGMSISSAFKQGLRALDKEVNQEKSVAPFEIFSQLELGKGGEARADSTQIKTTLRETIAGKHSQ